MIEIYDKFYYLNIDNAIRFCSITPIDVEDDIEFIEDDDSVDENNDITINVFKYELVKMMIETLLTNYQEPDTKMMFSQLSKESSSFKFAFNTLIKYKILEEENYE